MKTQKKLKRCALAGLLCLNVLGAFSLSFATQMSIGRYLTVATKPKLSQERLLQQQIQIKFPENVFTIKEAMQFMLQFSGYRLANLNSMGNASNAMLCQALPEVDRNFGPMSLEQGLLVLSGDAFYLLVDPVHRLVAFQIKPQYAFLYQKRQWLNN